MLKSIKIRPKWDWNSLHKLLFRLGWFY